MIDYDTFCFGLPASNEMYNFAYRCVLIAIYI